MKPREFWITSNIIGDETGGLQRWAFEKPAEYMGYKMIHVREVAPAEEGVDIRKLPSGEYVRHFEYKPIDWEAILKEFKLRSTHRDYSEFTLIQQLVESQLKGNE